MKTKITSLLLALFILINPALGFSGPWDGGSSSGGEVSDTAYGVSWNADTTTAPSKNAVYDKIEALTLGGAVDDTAYNATTWNGVTTSAPSQNAVRDKFESLQFRIVPYASGAAPGSVGIGSSALASQSDAAASSNTAFGNYALKSVTDGTQNTAVGFNALQGVTSADWNTAVGESALSGALTGIKNTAVGANNGSAMTSGTLNTSVGYHTQTFNEDGNNNTSIGVDSLYSNVSGDTNTAAGYSSLRDNLSNNNSGFGANSLLLVSTGSGNSALGYRAGAGLVTGSDNTFIGEEAGYGLANPSVSNSISVGANLNFDGVTAIGNSTNGTSFIFGMPNSTQITYGHFFNLPFNGSGGSRSIGVVRPITGTQHGTSLILSGGGASPNGQVITLSGTPTAGGTGYTLYDILTISTGGANSKAIVSAVSGGVVTSVTKLTNGSGYSTGTGQATTGGTGTGCTLNITAIASSANRNGGDVIIQPGESTGTGISKAIIRGYSRNSSSSSDDNTVVDRVIVPSPKNLTDSATSLFEIALPTLTMTGGSIDWTIEASDGTDMQSLSGITTFAAVNKGGTYTTTVTNATANDAKAVSSGTLTTAWAFLNGTNKVTMQLTPTGSLTETTYRVTYTVTNNSPQAITIL